MVFNKRKFNVIMCFTLVLICLAVVFSTVDVSSLQSMDDPDQSYAEPDNPNGGDEPTDPTTPTDPSDEDEIPEEDEGKFQKLNVTFTNGWVALNYALGLLEDNDYKITFSQQIEAKDTTFNQTGTQKINKEIYNFGGIGYVKAIADGSDIPLGMGENYTDYIVVNSSSVDYKRDGGNLTTSSIDDYLAKYGYLPNGIPYTLNMSTASLSFNIVRPKNGSAYYELNLTLNSKAWAGYLVGLEATGGEGSNPQMQSIVLTIRIDKDYGYITSLTATEKYTIKRASFTANSNSTVMMQFSYYGDFQSKADEIKSQLA